MIYQQNCLLGLLGLFVTVCQCVKITNLKVPVTYSIDENVSNNNLVLDCEYEFEPKETGFVLKWLFNEIAIYQWIPSHKPYALAFMKGRVDTSYTVSIDKYYKHRALLITKPLWNMTGDFTCHVQTFERSDKKSAHLQIIVPENNFQLTHNVDETGNVNIRCSANDIYPEPKIIISLGENEEHNDAQKNTLIRSENGLFDFTVERNLPKEKLESPTAINCMLSLPGTNYTKKRETIFYDQITTTMIDPDDDENSSASSHIDSSDNGNSGEQISLSAQRIASTIIILMVFSIFY